MTINTVQLPTYPAAAGITRLAASIFAHVVDVFTAFKNRRALSELSNLDERMLRDIGLTRGDLRDAISEPLWRDPTAILVSRAGERRVTRNPFSAVPASFVDSPSLVPTAGAGARLYVASR
ncbi:hypothetical protein GJW-30_1_01159 [Variibacter gotjawalensis]|uniref:YjiS-like domain-containing protein n=1 Tax=Variibacter gotjawalensis TaxID=1333996 RepID=A0A0S3PRQ7_9BRAD|nr:DUF1127 domain-containing protein [Variibacter gotjawalensis]NIK48942.1 uncharacterized protein YjiS (DUF1127 family) [Variibacter gotjawalensis]RZS50798.1 uncharacterized protein DUF1127 [Variibacter gotjawalensis]BAT58632.1 hypothetical protein GJW-30_1_01159 [Variibacter gotjawalensis]